jgi:hypothetical protein
MRNDGEPGIVIGGTAAELLAARYALVVAIVDEDRAPYASRGWGLTQLPVHAHTSA